MTLFENAACADVALTVISSVGIYVVADTTAVRGVYETDRTVVVYGYGHGHVADGFAAAAS